MLSIVYKPFSPTVLNHFHSYVACYSRYTKTLVVLPVSDLAILFNISPILLHDVLKRPEEVLLEAEVGQLAFLQELHGELPQ